MSPNVILKTNILKKCEELLKDVTKPPKMDDLDSPWGGEGFFQVRAGGVEGFLKLEIERQDQ